MYEYEEECYYEPSIADELLTEYQEKMKEALLSSVKSKFDAIKAENENLKEQNAKLKKKVEEIDNRERHLKIEKSNMLRDVRKERLSELMKDFHIIMYKIYQDHIMPEKCNKCDDNRNILFNSPSGKVLKENCECKNAEKFYKPIEYQCKSFKIDRDGKKMDAWYEENKKNNGDDDYYERSYSQHCGKIYDETMEYKDGDEYYNLFFKTKEECQKYCDWKNNLKGE